jgi:hypothetical protein
MGYSKKAKMWMPTDITSGEVSVSELQAKIASDLKAANAWATGTWDEPNTLTDAQIKALDSATSKKNGIGCPVNVATDGDPRGFSAGTAQWARKQEGDEQ